MNAELLFTEQGRADLKVLEGEKSKAAVLKQVRKALGYLQINPRHPSLNTHEFSSLENPFNPKEKVFEAYAQNNTPGAYRIFWCYGPDKNQITVIAITPHP
jgi:hypothetical protein